MLHYILKLKKGASYTNGKIAATRKSPQVIVDDEAAMKAAISSGYFDLVGTEQTEDEPADALALNVTGEADSNGNAPAQFDRADLETMSFTDLKKLANSMGIKGSKTMKKADYIDAISAEPVTVPAADDDDVQADFGEE